MAALKRLFLLCGAVVLVDTIFYAGLTPLLPHYAHEFGLSKTGVGFLAATYALGNVVFGIPAGLAASWLGVKRTVLLGIFGTAAMTVLFAFAQSVWLLDTARFLQGAFSACSWIAALAWLVADSPAESRGRLLGSAMGAALFGALLGPVVGGIASFAGIGVTFTAVASLGIVLAVWAAVTPSTHEPLRQPLGMLARSLGNRRIVLGIWFVALPSAAFGAINVLASLRLSVLGVGAAGIGATWLVAAGVEAVAAPVLGEISDRRGRLAPLRAALAGTAIVLAALAAAESRWWLLAPAVVAAGFAVGVFWAPAFSLLSDEAEATGLDYAFAFTLINLAWAPSQIAGSAGGAALAQATSDSIPYFTLSALCLLTLAFLWRSASSS
ncbi:MAG: MFS transporter [Gaiellaceae bacterium]